MSATPVPSTPREKFEVLHEAHVDYGGRYEYLMVSYVALQLMQDPKIQNFKLSNNSKVFGTFDDLVVETESPVGATATVATQLKHNKAGKYLTSKELGADGKNDFNIKKYFEDRQSKIDTKCYSEDTKVLLFTNRHLTDGKTFKFEKEPYIVTVKKSTDTCGMDTSANSSVYQLEIELQKGQLELVTGRLNKYKKFFDFFYIYTDQKNVTQLEQEISRKFSQTYGTDRRNELCYVKLFEDWCRKETQEGYKNKLYKEDVGSELGLILLEPHIIKSFIPKTSSPKAIALTVLISQFDVILIEESCGKLIENLSDTCRDCLVISVNERNKNLVNQAINLLYNNNKKQKCILVGDGVDSDELKNCGIRVFQSLADGDLQCDHYKNVVDTFSCVMQGREETRLGHIFKDDDELKSCFKVGVLLQMVHDKFVIGDNTVELPEHYINRSIVKKKFTSKLIGKLVNEILIISCSDNGELEKTVNELKNSETTVVDIANNRDYVIENQNSPLIVLSNYSYSTSEFDKICSKLKVTQPVFHFEMIENHLDLLNTRTSPRHLSRFSEYTVDESIQDEDILQKCTNKTNVLVADPGMGKTICGDSIKQTCPFDLWPIKINLREKLNSFRQFDKIDEFLTHIVYSHESNAANGFRNHYMTSKKILLIWDGLDEIGGSENEDLVIKKIKEISNRGHFQWITSRCYLQDKLESSLKVLATTLTKVTPEDRKKYIYDRLLEIYGDDTQANVDAIHERIFKNDNDMLAGPLLLHMVTTICRDRTKLNQIIQSEITITKIYGMFFDAKFDHFKSKIVTYETEALYSKIQDGIKVYRMSMYRKAALRICFAGNLLISLQINCDSFWNDIAADGDVFGIMTKDNSGTPTFVHQTLAEYCAALYLAKKHRKLGCVTMRELFRLEYKNIRFFFDMCLSEGHPAHQAVLERNLSKLENLDKDKIFSKDKGGRNALHLASSYGTRRVPLGSGPSDISKKRGCEIFVSPDLFDSEFDSLEKDDSDYNNIVKIYLVDVAIEKRQDFNNYKDEIYQLNCVEYADISLSLCALDAIVKILENRGISEFQKFLRNYKDVECLVAYSIVFDYKNLFSILSNIQPYFELVDSDGFLNSNTIILTVKYGRDNMLARLLERKESKGKIDETVDGVNPLSCAVEQNNLDLFKKLIQHGAKKNNYFHSFSERSILDFIVEQGKIDFVKHLVEEEPQQIDINFNSLIEIACRFGHLDIYNYCITKGADVDGSSLLLTAASEGRFHIVNHLWYNGANISAKNTNGTNVLHYACYHYNLEFIQRIPNEKLNELDSKDFKDKTPLLTASSVGHFNIVNYLLENGFTITANKDWYGKNVLHHACDHGNLEFIQKIPNEKLSELDSKDCDNMTPLLAAASKGHFNIVNYLLENGFTITANKDWYGKNVLHYACDHGNLEFIQKIPNEKLSELDSKDCDNMTPLLAATSKGYFNIVNYLLENGFSVPPLQVHNHLVLNFACLYGSLELLQSLSKKKLNELNDSEDNVYLKALLLESASRGHFNVVNYLLKNGFSITANKDESKRNVLHYACQYGNLEFIQSLSRKKLRSFNNENRYKYTPLITAASSGHFNIVNYLSENGCSITGKSRFGKKNVLHHVCTGPVNSDRLQFIKNLSQENIVELDKCSDPCSWEPTPSEIVKILRDRLDRW